MENNNEISSLRFAILRALKNNISSSNCKLGYVKTLAIDLPFSQDNFNNFFKKFVPEKKPIECGKILLKLSVNQMKIILGKNWFVYNHPNSSTRQRVLGFVQINYREKKISITQPEDSR